MPSGPDDLPAPGGLLGADDLLARLDRWVATARSDDAIATRARERWLRTAAEESSSFAGVLVDLAERRSVVVVHTSANRRHRGTIDGVGADFVALRLANDRLVLVALDGVASVRAEPGTTVVGDRDVHLELGLAEALAALSADRPRVLVLSGGAAPGDGVAGELRAAGLDVLTVVLDAPNRPVAYIPVPTITEITLT